MPTKEIELNDEEAAILEALNDRIRVAKRELTVATTMLFASRGIKGMPTKIEGKKLSYEDAGSDT